MWPVPEDLTDTRVDAALAEISGMSRATVVGLIAEGRDKLNNRPIAKSAKVEFGDVIEIDLPDPDMRESEPTVELPIVFQDADIVVINKPAGIAAHPSQGWRSH